VLCLSSFLFRVLVGQVFVLVGPVLVLVLVLAGLVLVLVLVLVGPVLVNITGNHTHGITQFYLSPVSSDFPAFTAAKPGTRVSDSGGVQG